MQQRKDNQQVQTLDPDLVWLKIRRHPRWKKQKRIAKRLNRSTAAISMALKGKLPKLLARIDRLLETPRN